MFRCPPGREPAEQSRGFDVPRFICGGRHRVGFNGGRLARRQAGREHEVVLESCRPPLPPQGLIPFFSNWHTNGFVVRISFFNGFGILRSRIYVFLSVFFV